MKKTLSIIATVAAFAGLGLASGTVAHAANTTSANTNANITLKSGNPDEGAGGIVLNSAPSYGFGTVTLDGSAKSVPGTANGDVKITNPGVASGWKLTVSNSAMTDGTNTFKSGNLVLTSTGAKAEGENSTTVTTPASVSLNMSGTNSAQVLSADANQGLGIWDGNYTGATLDVPADAVATSDGSAYSSKLTWTLANSVN